VVEVGAQDGRAARRKPLLGGLEVGKRQVGGDQLGFWEPPGELEGGGAAPAADVGYSPWCRTCAGEVGDGGCCVGAVDLRRVQGVGAAGQPVAGGVQLAAECGVGERRGGQRGSPPRLPVLSG
jgi:hypothetical protein